MASDWALLAIQDAISEGKRRKSVTPEPRLDPFEATAETPLEVPSRFLKPPSVLPELPGESPLGSPVLGRPGYVQGRSIEVETVRPPSVSGETGGSVRAGIGGALKGLASMVPGGPVSPVESAPAPTATGSGVAGMIPAFGRNAVLPIAGNLLGKLPGVAVGSAVSEAVETQRDERIKTGVSRGAEAMQVPQASGQELPKGRSVGELAKDPWTWGRVAAVSAFNTLAFAVGSAGAAKVSGAVREAARQGSPELLKQALASAVGPAFRNIGVDVADALTTTAITLEQQGMEFGTPEYKSAFVKAVGLRLALAAGFNVAGGYGDASRAIGMVREGVPATGVVPETPVEAAGARPMAQEAPEPVPAPQAPENVPVARPVEPERPVFDPDRLEYPLETRRRNDLIEDIRVTEARMRDPDPMVQEIAGRDRAALDEILRRDAEARGKGGEDDAPTVEVPAVPDSAVVRPIHEPTGLPLNEDGTVTLYHGTTPEGAEGIRKTKILKSAGEPDVYLTTDPKGGEYGPEVVAVRIHPSKLALDDEFPGGRKDFSVSTGKPGGRIRVASIEPEPRAGQSAPPVVAGEAPRPSPPAPEPRTGEPESVSPAPAKPADVDEPLPPPPPNVKNASRIGPDEIPDVLRGSNASQRTYVQALRDYHGSEMTSPQRKADQTTLDNAVKAGFHESHTAESLSREAMAGRLLSDEEEAGMVYRTREIVNARKELDKMLEAGEQVTANGRDIDLQIEALDAELDFLQRGLFHGGTDIARALRIRQMGLTEQFEIGPYLSRVKRAAGRDLTPTEVDYYRGIVEQNKAMAAEIENLQKVAVEKTVEKSLQTHKNSRPPRMPRQDFEARIAKVRRLITEGCAI